MEVTDPSRKPKGGPMVPHPDDEPEVRAGLEEAKRGEVLSEQESAEYVDALLGDDDTPQ